MREATQPATEHEHSSPVSLALELDDLDEDRILEIQEQVRSCPECLLSLEVLVYWLDTLGHWDPRVAPEFLTRHQLFAELLFGDEPHHERLGRLRQDERLHSWGLCRQLLDASRQAAKPSRTLSLQLAELTHTVAETLDEGFYGSEWVGDLRAEAAGHLALLHRQRRRREEAVRLFRHARECLSTGTGRLSMSRLIQDLESLYSGDRSLAGVGLVPAEGRSRPKEAVEAVDLYRPVHQLLERCQALP